YSGTLSGIDRIRAGEAFDAAWFANAKYLLLGDTQHRVKASERIMLSPVIIGVKAGKAKAFGWTPGNVTWKQIASKSGSGAFRYAMTNPTSSNSGFSALIAVASALAGASDAIHPSDVNAAKLRTFFRGQTLTAGSSGWLADAYVRDQDRLDGIVNYEANLIALNKSGQLHEGLVLLYPKEGVLTADYPLLLLNEADRPAFEAVTSYLKSSDFQTLLMTKTFRRPVTAGVALSSDFPRALVNEVSFPSSLAAVDGILLRYLNDNRVPSHSFYVIDTSGSMQGSRLAGVQQALHTLAGDDPSLTGKFARFENREEISFVSFSDAPRAPVDFTMHSANDTQTLQGIRDYADGLQAGGNTAIFSAVETALDDAARARSTEGARYYSIVLMTDGENNRGDDFDAFSRRYAALPPALHIKVFPILFGEGSQPQLQRLADLTGGRLFDGTKEPLSTVFKEIRGYQ
ncbi:MAG TPA: VWA domain-containing protein, partial [Candidatus Baltobacteraceae bacterium]|nr:VWA domain-containing protein [Candidatus Baltobacteraceae bacterium]